LDVEKAKLDVEKAKLDGLAQQNGLGAAQFA
jgi:hypothetical protein